MTVTNPLARLPALRRVPLFRGLAKATLLEVARRVTEVASPAGTVVVREGDPGDALCIIVEGTVEVIKDGRAVAHMTGGDFFGEISLIDGKPRSATVIATRDVVVLVLSASDFRDLLNIPLVARAALESLARRLREAHDEYGPEGR